ncbi:MAG TPA: SRPBCC family protein, partial [Acidimicrobiales bacterium]|nr:SRPBCC family protein [Acidimicrobiales bacterium]
MQQFESGVDIARPLPVVFDALRRLDELPVWTPGVLELRRTGGGGGPAEVGSTGAFVGRLLGRSFESELR